MILRATTISTINQVNHSIGSNNIHHKQSKAILPRVISLCRIVLTAILCHILFPHVASSALPPPQIPSSPNILRNLARGSALKCLADLGGGLPFEVWKSSVVLENIHFHSKKNATNEKKKRNHDGKINLKPHQNSKPRSDIAILRDLINTRGIPALYSGCAARMTEGVLSGAVLLAAKEGIKRTLTATFMTTIIPTTASSPALQSTLRCLSPSAIAFLAGAGGGAAQAIVMAPCSMLVTACATNQDASVLSSFVDIWSNHGLMGIYRGTPAVAARQATNWASRQGFTELIRPRIALKGIPGEIIAGCLGGTLSCWNTPFEVARIESQTSSFLTSASEMKNDNSLLDTMNRIVEQRGIGGLYTGLLPRVFQSCYQTVFLVCVPRLLGS
mmetsp:Transcript_14201/g.20281  ORF Transcript_14201/g.20281 Transcript_14201/m.20281 type:complete len:387 (+) Transcript_14201:15-1175(+)